MCIEKGYNISVLIHKRVLNRLACVYMKKKMGKKKMLWLMKLLDLPTLNPWLS
jgi:hypothetical protein